jgi:hypothetical protein
MAKCGVLENLLLKDHTHTFVNTVRGGSSSRGLQQQQQEAAAAGGSSSRG